MRNPGREFGSPKPKVIYVALRWNGSRPQPKAECDFVQNLAKKLGCYPGERKIFNLCRPKKDLGMALLPTDYKDVEKCLLKIKAENSADRIVIGGRSGPMPNVAIALKLLVPKVRIEVAITSRPGALNAP